MKIIGIDDAGDSIPDKSIGLRVYLYLSRIRDLFDADDYVHPFSSQSCR
jgi:hypothetical protein